MEVYSTPGRNKSADEFIRTSSHLTPTEKKNKKDLIMQRWCIQCKDKKQQIYVVNATKIGAR